MGLVWGVGGPGFGRGQDKKTLFATRIAKSGSSLAGGLFPEVGAGRLPFAYLPS
jgi:hypothetical protein